jgi:hypothetical protein
MAELANHTAREEITRRAIAAAKYLGREVVISTDADLTPTGKRRAQIVHNKLSGRKAQPHLRWFVGVKSYRSLLLTDENVTLSKEWLKAGSTPK